MTSTGDATGRWHARHARNTAHALNPSQHAADVLLFAADLPTTINWPGRYRLAEDATITGGQPAITIDASNVSLDLGGHTLAGDGHSATPGILAGKACKGPVTVRNGTIMRWGGDGLRLVGVRGCRVDAITAQGNGGRGIAVDADATLIACTSIANNDR
ncbi:MAG: hypothetical protein JNM80_08785 [Phycisphaerae bacterium]|nr:hypothetical protein [Phycisphaerae bacterium]